MIILAIDSASKACSACVYNTDTQRSACLFGDAVSNHSETLLPAVKKTLEAMNVTVKDVDRIAVTVGPGSFTGVKIGVAEAKGLAFTYNTPCVAVSSLHALAEDVQEDGVICAVLDARRNQFYNALFRRENGKLTRLCQDRQIKAEDLVKEINDGVLLAGDGAELLAHACAEAGITYKIVGRPDGVISSESVAHIAHTAETVMSETLSPIYLRPSQAERIRLGIND